MTTRAFQRPCDWGVGARAGHFYEGALLRVTAGLDYEWGKYSSKAMDGHSTRLKPAAIKELDALALRIAAQPPYVELKVNIVGHTRPTGADRNNVALSTKRADAVKSYLVS